MWAERIFGASKPFEWCHFAEMLASARCITKSFTPIINKSISRVEEALNGFLSILSLAKKQSKEDSNTLLHEQVLKGIEEMTFVAAEILRLPQNESLYGLNYKCIVVCK